MFACEPFAVQYPDRCRSVEGKLIEDAVEELSAAATSGSWSGTAGEPMPRDLETREAARRVLAGLSRLSPACALYAEVLKDAERRIARSIEEGKRLDEED
ncbi:hypothetical protein [Salinarimonas ramus]|nr:hypothetical protein [Salinarimonas ramus]